MVMMGREDPLSNLTSVFFLDKYRKLGIWGFPRNMGIFLKLPVSLSDVEDWKLAISSCVVVYTVTLYMEVEGRRGAGLIGTTNVNGTIHFCLIYKGKKKRHGAGNLLQREQVKMGSCSISFQTKPHSYYWISQCE
ncbi:hypothetical protein Ancab_000099 [Ancistrocladus abbreviatus]